MLLAVFSYPKHYHITQLAIKQARKMIEGITDVLILWDDTHPELYETPLYRHCGATQIPWSAFNIDATGWTGQQAIKLYSDTVIQESEYILLDGDCLIGHPVDPKNVLYSSPVPRQHGNYNHLRDALGLPNYSFSNTPFMYVKREWLQDIRNRCMLSTNTALDQKIKESQIDGGYMKALNEWNLISGYQLEVLRLPRKIDSFYYRLMQSVELEKNYSPTSNLVLKGNDNLSKDFYKDAGVTIDEVLWKQLCYA